MPYKECLKLQIQVSCLDSSCRYLSACHVAEYVQAGGKASIGREGQQLWVATIEAPSCWCFSCLLEAWSLVCTISLREPASHKSRLHLPAHHFMPWPIWLHTSVKHPAIPVMGIKWLTCQAAATGSSYNKETVARCWTSKSSCLVKLRIETDRVETAYMLSLMHPA